jgi:hypothetical protein
LKIASVTNKNVKVYYDYLIENRKAIKIKRKNKPKKFTYELFKEYVEEENYFFLTEKQAKKLSIEVVKKIADEFIKITDETKQKTYLLFFSFIKFPYGYKLLFSIAMKNMHDKSIMFYYALETLKYFNSKEIRQLAINGISFEVDEDDYHYLKLLVNNYKKGDYKLLAKVANRSDDFHYIHSIADKFLEIYKANPLKECKAPLEAIYYKINCGICRSEIIKILIENNVLSNEIFAELEFDSYYRVRKLHRQYKNKFV